MSLIRIEQTDLRKTAFLLLLGRTRLWKWQEVFDLTREQQWLAFGVNIALAVWGAASIVWRVVIVSHMTSADRSFLYGDTAGLAVSLIIAAAGVVVAVVLGSNAAKLGMHLRESRNG